MCWSGEASLVLAMAGIATTGYVASRGESPRLYAPLGYFSLMELLQAFTYPVIDECSLPANQIATLLGYVHIAFQPLFINLIAMYFIPDDIRRRIEYPVYALSLGSALVMLLQLYPFAWAGECPLGAILCARELCSVQGNWHIAWHVPVNGLTNPIVEHSWSRILTIYPSYVITGLVLPILYGSWRFGLYHYLVGPKLASLLTDNPNEVPAIWCLFSIAILILVVKTPVRRVMHVRNWPLWPGRGQQLSAGPS